MLDNVLYIIGNGFDCHHHVKSRYAHFRDWLKEHDQELFSLYETVCPYDALWNDFETGMAYVSRDYLLDNGLILLPEKGWDPDIDNYADLFMAADNAKYQASELIVNLKNQFHRWVQRIGTPGEYDSRKLIIDPYARFLSFNYTTFLESKYGIPREQIKYIHGHKLGSIGSIIVGHGEDDDKIFKEWERRKGYHRPRYNRKGQRYFYRDEAWKVYHSHLPEYEMIAESIESYYSEAAKPVEEIIRKNKGYFEDLYDIRTIYVWGFSFSKVDMPYLREIVKANDSPQSIRWNVSYYNDSDQDHFTARLLSLGVKPSQISFRPLSHWQIKV